MLVGIVTVVLYNSSMSNVKLEGKWEFIEELGTEKTNINTFTFDGNSFIYEVEYINDPNVVRLGFDVFTDVFTGTFTLTGNYLTGHTIEFLFTGTEGKTLLEHIWEYVRNETDGEQTSDFDTNPLVGTTQVNSISISGNKLSLTYDYSNTVQHYIRIS